MRHDHGVSREAVAAAGLIEALNMDDERFIHDAVEGETGFFEAVQRALDEMAECEIVSAGIKDMQSRLSDRLRRTQARHDRLRGMIDQAFQMAEIKTHKFPTATITTKAVPPKLIVQDEAEVPSSFFEAQPPKLDKSRLLAACKEAPVAGATLTNGGTTIQIRRA